MIYNCFKILIYYK